MSEFIQMLVGFFVGGVLVGRWLEARKWREKAENGTLRESGGRLYRVTRG